MDPAALLVQPWAWACRGVVMPLRHDCTHHPRTSTATLPVLQHGDTRYLPRQDIGYKKLQIKEDILLAYRVHRKMCLCVLWSDWNTEVDECYHDVKCTIIYLLNGHTLLTKQKVQHGSFFPFLVNKGWLILWGLNWGHPQSWPNLWLETTNSQNRIVPWL